MQNRGGSTRVFYESSLTRGLLGSGLVASGDVGQRFLSVLAADFITQVQLPHFSPFVVSFSLRYFEQFVTLNVQESLCLTSAHETGSLRNLPQGSPMSIRTESTDL